MIDANWNVSSTSNQPCFIGNVYRQNIISSMPGNPGSERIFIVTNAGSSNVDAMQALMNVFDSNVISQVHYAIAFASTTPLSVGGLGGLLDTILWNNFASSDGASNANKVFQTEGASGVTDSDPMPFFFGVNNIWELVDNGWASIGSNPV